MPPKPPRPKRVPVTRTSHRILLAWLLLGAGPLLALPGAERASFHLQSDLTSYAPPTEAVVAAVVEIEDHWHTNSNQPTYDYLIPTELAVAVPEGWPEPRITYPEGVLGTFTFAEEPLSVYEGTTVILAHLEIPTEATESTIEAVLTYQACNDTQCLPPISTMSSLTLDLGGLGEAHAPDLFAEASTQATGRSATASATGTSSGAPPTTPLWTFLLLGLLGGLILNAMPCVLPVLSIKVFSLVKSASLSRGEVIRSGLATALGILVSFWALAGAAIAARSAGRAVGWGVQFQEPLFVAFLAVVVLLFTLNMWGLFEIQLPGGLARLGGSGPQEGLAGHFVSGLFATLMATPCSAPFLGTAVSFALAQAPVTIFAIFTAVGVGMASPYLLLAAWPGAARFLPKPGAWMVRLREVMGFFLAAAAIWLFYVLAGQISAERLAFVELALLLLALAVWTRHAFGGVWGQRLGTLAIAATVGGTLWLAATAPPLEASTLESTGGHIAWTPFDRERATELTAAGTPVFVDVTADWCFTCKVNERFVLDTPEIAAAFAARDVVPMQADWTNRNAEIGAFLADYGRYGIPFYLLYRPGAEPYVFGELLTQQGILDALDTL